MDLALWEIVVQPSQIPPRCDRASGKAEDSKIETGDIARAVCAKVFGPRFLRPELLEVSNPAPAPPGDDTVDLLNQD